MCEYVQSGIKIQSVSPKAMLVKVTFSSDDAMRTALVFDVFKHISVKTMMNITNMNGSTTLKIDYQT
ncbi:hypothetical protein NECAME_00121 [Necator americanus]|uniref:Uncharacterized protein n=1 Tax=Necator americanus TaxID=51031 RepID=W2U1S7_NECAM|nr:hypothetical protein NECAME_00121 [Necator americanus]ETN87262.1 hypothetical protein NECAME_00121 [Necator americanus]